MEDSYIATWGLTISTTVYVQIFEVRKFQGCHKSSILRFYFQGSPSILLSDSCKLKFTNEISRMKILQMASLPRKPQKLHSSKICM